MGTTPDDLDGRLKRSLDVGAPDLSSDIVTGAPGRKAPRMVNRGRVAQVAAGSLTAVAAVSVGALVIGGSLTATQPPLFTAASGGADGARIAGAEAAIGADAMIMPWVQYEYLAGDALGTSGGTGSVYELRRLGTPEDTLARIAGLYGVEGSVERSEWFSDDYPSFVVGPEDGTAPAVTTTWVGTGNWWYSNPLPFREDVPSPSLAPSGAEAQRLAAELFAGAGLTISPDQIVVYADEWQTTATGHLVVAGQRTALDWSVSWSATGDIQWASGHAVEAVERGSFGTVSARDAVERLADWRWGAAPGPDFQGDVSFIAADAPVSSGMARTEGDLVEPAPGEPGVSEPGSPGEGVDPVEPTEPTEPTEPEPAPEPEPTVEPAPEPTVEPAPEPLPEPLPEPEVVTVTLDEATPTLLLMWDADGNAWLVPGYAFEMPDGWFSGVVSLVEGVIALPEPVEFDILPIEEGVVEDR
ncbi:hypothetical protein [Microcella alkaliphila]|uniref:LPXTG-motif cell wall anchor domain protein n=1 Tax=Microcella alkaliphila TaxID=279828 RepID=A0A0U5BRJ4_9MICO|nr:hypothetical protein [Microcella alkaliphila]BAU32934.1 LPXTG-motif cell wall anchor domain protein [Microcella alkaliphila]